MSYLIIAVVIALALAPIMALKPSKMQKMQARLRDQARELGLQVQVCSLPQTHRQQVRREDTQSGVFYRLLWRHPEGKYQAFDYLLHRHEVERNTAPGPILKALQECLGQLPEVILAVEYNNAGVGVYWREQDGEKVAVDSIVADIAAQLRALKTTLEGMPPQPGDLSDIHGKTNNER